VKAVIYHSHDDIRLEELPVPTIQAEELLIRVHGCGLCGSDIGKIVQHAPPPVVLGHELTGTIVACREHVTAFAEGQDVIVAHHVPCGTCHYCQRGNYSMCATFKASNIAPCGLAEYVRVPAAHVQHTTLPLPASLSAIEGSFTEPLACCVRAVRRTPLHDGDTIVIVGLGSIGLLMLQAFKVLGTQMGYALRVYGIDLLPARLQLARELGADEVFAAPAHVEEIQQLIAAYTEGRGADTVMLATPGQRPFAQALACTRKGGVIHIFTAHAGNVPFDLQTLYQQELTIISTYSSSPEDLRIALNLLTDRLVRVEQLISHRLPLERFHEGVAMMQTHTALKVYYHIAGEFHAEQSL
jgi:L-iditol 2-dehydrogenase